MNVKASAVLGICIIIAAVVFGIIQKMDSDSKYQMVTVRDGYVLLLDTHTGDSWWKFVPDKGGPVEWARFQKPE